MRCEVVRVGGNAGVAAPLGRQPGRRSPAPTATRTYAASRGTGRPAARAPCPDPFGRLPRVLGREPVEQHAVGHLAGEPAHPGPEGGDVEPRPKTVSEARRSRPARAPSADGFGLPPPAGGDPPAARVRTDGPRRWRPGRQVWSGTTPTPSAMRVVSGSAAKASAASAVDRARIVHPEGPVAERLRAPCRLRGSRRPAHRPESANPRAITRLPACRLDSASRRRLSSVPRERGKRRACAARPPDPAGDAGPCRTIVGGAACTSDRLRPELPRCPAARGASCSAFRAPRRAERGSRMSRAAARERRPLQRVPSGRPGDRRRRRATHASGSTARPTPPSLDPGAGPHVLDSPRRRPMRRSPWRSWRSRSRPCSAWLPPAATGFALDHVLGHRQMPGVLRPARAADGPGELLTAGRRRARLGGACSRRPSAPGAAISPRSRAASSSHGCAGGSSPRRSGCRFTGFARLSVGRTWRASCART